MVNLCWVVLGFSERIQQEGRPELVNDFATIANAVVAVVDVEEIIHGDS